MCSAPVARHAYRELGPAPERDPSCFRRPKGGGSTASLKSGELPHPLVVAAARRTPDHRYCRLTLLQLLEFLHDVIGRAEQAVARVSAVIVTRRACRGSGQRLAGHQMIAARRIQTHGMARMPSPAVALRLLMVLARHTSSTAESSASGQSRPRASSRVA